MKRFLSTTAATFALFSIGAEAQIQKVLVTNFYFGSSHASGRANALELVKMLGAEMGFVVEEAATEGKINADYLMGFDLVVWNNMSQNGLQAAAAKAAWQTYLEGGGAVLSLHASGDTRNGTWTWYMENLLDATYQTHSAVSAADAWIHSDAIAPNGQFHPVLKNQMNHFKKYPVTVNGKAQERWATVLTDEWYVFPKDPSPATRDLTVLIELDEFNTRGVTNWNPNETKTGYHPMSWARENIGTGKGRLAYLVTGHDDKIHAARDRGIKELWKNAMLWTTKNSTGCKNQGAANYNPWADKEDASCGSTSTYIDTREPMENPFADGAGGSNLYIPIAGRFKVVLRNLSGRSISSEMVTCPCESAISPSVPPGAYFLNLSSSKHTILHGLPVSKN